MASGDTALVERLHALGEHLAAGYMELPDAGPERRVARALRRHFERAPLPPCSGGPLYPAGAAALPEPAPVIRFLYFAGMTVDRERLAERLLALPPEDGAALREAADAVWSLYRVGSSIPPRYSLGGAGFTHAAIHYGRAVREGLAGVEARIARAERDAGGPTPFHEAMRDTLAGVRAIVARARERAAAAGRGDLADALERVPERPAASFRDAMVAVNLIWYLDGCDSLGRFDQDLGPLLDADLGAGRVTRAEALELVRALWASVDACSGWNVAIGGSRRDGSGAANTLTELCLEAAAGRRRPNLALRVRRDTPDAIWERALDAIGSGCGLPALYNEEGYLAAMRAAWPEIGEDAAEIAFGGCTETMVHGRSCVGSIDGGLNLAEVLACALPGLLERCSTFEALVEGYLERVREEVRAAVDCVRRDQARKAAEQPQPFRSLWVDDCIERGLDFHAGGARYNGGVFNVGGIANVADSLAAVRELVYEGETPWPALVTALADNWEGHEELAREARAAPRFGNDDDRVDTLAARIARETFDEIRRHRTARGDGPFLPACILFVTYAWAGEAVGATPDGRRSGEPIADSVGPVQGRDTHGPTAMLRSVAKLPLGDAHGTPILNIRLAPELFRTREGRDKVRALVRSFFDLGGMQAQATVVDGAVLRDAIEQPERHADLIVRIGGYSEYFNHLSPALKLAVLERTEHR